MTGLAPLGTAVEGDLLTWWWASLAAGLVVLLAVAGLLHLLLEVVHRIHDRLLDVWRAGAAVARNTATTWMLDNAAGHAERLRRELEVHQELLRERGG